MSAFDVRDDVVVVKSGFGFALIRTDRVALDGRGPSPAHLGRLPVRPTRNYAGRLPAAWSGADILLAPVYDGEALWVEFEPQRPHAVQVEIDGVDAITGTGRQEPLTGHPQNYIVAPPQKWLDGVTVPGGGIRQFVAHPSRPEVAGATPPLRLRLVPPRQGGAAFNLRLNPYITTGVPLEPTPLSGTTGNGSSDQHIAPDPFGMAAWDEAEAQTCGIFWVDVEWFREVTGERGTDPPPPPPARAR